MKGNAPTSRQVSGTIFEVQTFYAFAVLATGYATPNDTKTLSKPLEAAGILEKLWKQNANHPESFIT